MINALPCGPYRHYRGGLYYVEGVATHSETQEPMVVYRSLDEEAQLWVRPLSMFTEEIPTRWGPVPRFQMVLPQPVRETA